MTESDDPYVGTTPPDEAGLVEADLPETPAWVGELLASLRADDPPTPDDVVARTDAALAALRHSDVLPPSAGTDPVSHPVAGDPTGPTGTEAADVVPIGQGARHSRRREPSSPWGHRLLLGGVAAAAVLVLGGLGTVAVIRGDQPSNTPPVTAQDNSTTGDPEAAAVRYVASGEDYAPTTLAADAAQVVAAADGPSGQPGPSASPATVGPPPSPMTLAEPQTRPSAGCLTAILDGATGVSVLVDEARYVGQPVYVIVVHPGADGTGTDIWVVARTCSATDDGLVTFARS